MITVLGSAGFIGSYLIKKLEALNIKYQAPHKNDNLNGLNLGNIIYCIGLTSDFRTRPLDTVQAHVCKVLEILNVTKFESILYLSSTRLYGNSSITDEVSAFNVDPLNPSDLYNISKLLGESLLYNSGHKVKVARLSNVYGNDFDSNNFLSDIIKQAIENKYINIETTLSSQKDYISVDDVVDLLIKISLYGKSALYNVASGINTLNSQIIDRLVYLTECKVNVSPRAKDISFPKINVDLISKEFSYQPSIFMDDIDDLVQYYKINREVCRGDHN